MSARPNGASPTGDGDGIGVTICPAPAGLDVGLSSLTVCGRDSEDLLSEMIEKYCTLVEMSL